MSSMRTKKNILWFEEVTNKDVPLVGGKNASLGEMYQKLTKQGVPIPNGFAVTASAYRTFIKKAGLEKYIEKTIAELDVSDLRELQKVGKAIRRTIIQAPFPKDLEHDLLAAYKKFGKQNDVAVRSSATAEDLPDASFAGQQETFLNVRGEKHLLLFVKRAMASLFTDRAISYRADKGFTKMNVALSVGVQQMVRSDLATSGVMFSIDTESGFDGVVIISAAYGLGENVVQGTVTPDLYTVFKKTLDGKHFPILEKSLGSKEKAMVYSKNPAKPIVNTPVTKKRQSEYALTDKEIVSLAKYAVAIENHYKRPMDMEWAKDGKTGKLFIVQARPETVHGTKKKHEIVEYRLQKRGTVLAEGRSVGEKIGTGRARVIRSIEGIHSFKAGEILITKMTDPDWEPIMKIAGGIVTDSGGRTSHAAIVAREMNIPAIVGTSTASKKIATGKEVTVSCSEGETGFVYAGKLPFTIKRTKLTKVPKTKTKVMLILGEPETAFGNGLLPVDGVGLARLEFIINNSVKIHPLALINYNKLTDKALKKKIAGITSHFTNKKEYYSQTLASGIARLAAGFYPRDVIVRFSDFKSNEYANLIGGTLYEPKEENPMIGWRGASRYYHPAFIEAFRLECKAVKLVRDRMGLTNVKVMLPFCRTTDEVKKVKAIMKQEGLDSGKNGLMIYQMVEIPSNVILLEEFAKLVDGFSIGSNDLTQLTLGMSRDSQIIAKVGDERNPAVMQFIADAVRRARAVGKPIGICGQGPSDFPELTAMLVKEGISTISVSPDRAIPTLLNIAKIEKKRR